MRDFNDLQFFAAVVLNCGFSAASRALKVPKSRISRRVALLEERLSVRLLDRSTRRLALTQVGQRVFEHARAAIIEAEAAEDAGLQTQAEPRGLVEASASLRCSSALLTESAKGSKA
jgi:DNA-binding transcriptional LysR family regulator